MEIKNNNNGDSYSVEDQRITFNMFVSFSIN